MAKKDYGLHKGYFDKMFNKVYEKNSKLEKAMNKYNNKQIDLLYERNGLLKTNSILSEYITKFEQSCFDKFDKTYTLKNIIRFILLNNKPYNVIKYILMLNFILLGIVTFALLPNILMTIKNFNNIGVLIIHSIFLLIYYFLLTKYTYNSYFINKLYKDDINVLFSKKEVIFLEEIIEFNKTPKLNDFKKEYFLKLKNTKEK